MREEYTRELLNKNIKGLEKIIKHKAGTYDLDDETVFNAFVKKIKADDYEMIRNIPGESSFETYVEPFIKSFMVEQAYFLQEERKFIEKVVRKIVKKEKISPDLYSQIFAFVHEGLEKNKFERLKKFDEKNNSKFTSFFYPVVCNLAFTFLRKHSRMEKASEKYVDDIIEAFSRPPGPPLTEQSLRPEWFFW